jgi:hypothetical protein
MDRTQTARIKRELAKIKKGLEASEWGDKEHGALYAAQQALAWVLDPKEAMAPAKMISELYPDLFLAMAARIEELEKALEPFAEALETLASALTKFAPDLMAELQIRFKQADGALDEFLAALRDTQS